MWSLWLTDLAFFRIGVRGDLVCVLLYTFCDFSDVGFDFKPGNGQGRKRVLMGGFWAERGRLAWMRADRSGASPLVGRHLLIGDSLVSGTWWSFGLAVCAAEVYFEYL